MYDIIVISLMCVLLFGVAFWLIFDFNRWKKIKVVVKEITNNRKQVREFKAREFTDSSKVSWWLLKGERDKIKKFMPIPPSESIDLTYKGKKFHECYRTEQGEYIPIIDVNKFQDIPKEEMNKINEQEQDYVSKNGEVQWHKYRNELIADYMVKNNIVCHLKPLTKEQRMALVNNIKKAELRTNKTWKENIPMYVSLGIFVIIFVCAMIFMPDLVKVLQKGNAEVVNSIQQYEKIRHDNLMIEMKEWEKVTTGMQVISGQIERSNDRLAGLDSRIAKVEQNGTR
jgi:hypothetical protein